MPTWYFETGNPPFIEGKDPAPSSTGNAQDTLISFDIVDAESYVRTDTVDAYVNGFLAFSGPSTFIAPFNGPSSSFTFIPGGSIDGYDAYRVVIDNTGVYPLSSTVTVRAIADDYGFNKLDENWTFDIVSGTAPFVEGYDPLPGETGVSVNTLITFYIVDPNNDTNSASIDAYVNGLDAYHGTIGFVSPFDGPSSSFTFLPGGSIDGYDAYEIIIDNTGTYALGSTVSVHALAEDYEHHILDTNWTFDIISGTAPFVEGYDPIPGETGVPANTLITFYIVDRENDTNSASIDAYVNGLDAYHGSIGFISPFDGPSSSFTFLPGGSIDGYDAYEIIIDNTGIYTPGSTVSVHALAEDHEHFALDVSWSFDIGIDPFIEQEDPAPGATGVSLYKEVSCFIADADNSIRSDKVDAYVDGVAIYDGLTDTFTFPYNGPSSALTFVSHGSLDGYDGYRLTIDRIGIYPQYTNFTVRVTAEDTTGAAADHSWSFRTETFAPFIESRSPAPGSTGIAVDTNISLVCADGYNLINPSTIEVDVDGADAYKGTIGFVAPFNGPSSAFNYIPGGSVDGYDAYQIILDRTTNFGYEQTVNVYAEVFNAEGQSGNSSWSFKTQPVPGVVPEIANISPTAGGSLPQNSLISFDIFDVDNDLDTATVLITIDGTLAYDGSSNSFFAPYTGVDSYAGPTIVDGYDGYHFVFDNTGLFSAITTVNAWAQDIYAHTLNHTWSYYTPNTALNRLYYSDEYGVYKIDLEDLVGESQFVAHRFLSSTMSPPLATNNISSISGNHIDGYALLVLSYGATESSKIYYYWGDFLWGQFVWGGFKYGDGYGVEVVTNEIYLNRYSDGYCCDRAQINNRGILYVANKTNDTIEVYYGANKRPGARPPDFIYDGYSTPALFSHEGNVGEVLSLHIVNDGSSELATGTRLYVGQSIGMTIIDTFDQESSDGYSAGLDSYGVSTYCGIVGSGATYENIGGVVPSVTDVATDEEHEVIFVVTNDGSGHGGLTQIGMTTNRKIIYMNKDSGFVPSDDIRKVSKNE